MAEKPPDLHHHMADPCGGLHFQIDIGDLEVSVVGDTFDLSAEQVVSKSQPR